MKNNLSELINTISNKPEEVDIRKKDKKVFRKRGSERIEYTKISDSDLNKKLARIIDQGDFSINKPFETFNKALTIFVNEIMKEAITNKSSYRFNLLGEELLVEYFAPRKVRNPCKGIDNVVTEEKIQLKLKSKRKTEDKL